MKFANIYESLMKKDNQNARFTFSMRYVKITLVVTEKNIIKVLFVSVHFLI